MAESLAQEPTHQTLTFIACFHVVITGVFVIIPEMRYACVPTVVAGITFASIGLATASSDRKPVRLAGGVLAVTLLAGVAMIALGILSWTRQYEERTQAQELNGDVTQKGRALQGSTAPAHARMNASEAATDARLLTQEVTQLRAQIASLSTAQLWEEILALRARVKLIPEYSTRRRLDAVLDDVILEVLNDAATKYYQRALDRYNGNDILGARKACKDAFDCFGERSVPPLGVKTLDDSEVWKAAISMWNTIQQITDPRYRFHLEGTMVSGGDVRARLTDLSTGKSITVAAGQKIEPFAVKEIDRDRSCVVFLNQFDETFELYH